MPKTSIRAPRDAAIGLGSSLGDRERCIGLAVHRLDATPGVEVRRVSRLYRTPPLRGGTARGWFLNAVVRVTTTLSGDDLLALARSLEARANRRRAGYWGDRTLDVDLLLVEGEMHETPALRLPHPAIRERPFVLTPLLEVWPEAIDPVDGQPYSTAPTPPPPKALPIGCIRWVPILQPPAPEGL